MNDQKTYLSKEKYEELKKELEHLINTKRTEVAHRLEEAKSFGDLSENAEYHAAREEKAALESRIQELETMFKSVSIVKHHSSNVVDVGTTVMVLRDGDSDKKTFEIVGSEETDTAVGKISLNSPLGKAMMGKKKKEAFTFTTPSGKKVQYTVVDIE